MRHRDPHDDPRPTGGVKINVAPVRTVKLGEAMSDESEIPDKPDPRYWRDRAQIARDKAELLSNPTARRRMVGVAASYERLAERIEQRMLKMGKQK